MTDGLPDPNTQLPSQVTAVVNLTASHIAVGIAGGLVTIGAVQPSLQAAAIPVISGIIVWALGQGYAYVVQHFRHKQAVAAVAQAKAS